MIYLVVLIPTVLQKLLLNLLLKLITSVFLKNKTNQKIAIARAGNVVGGGDWSENRLLPDCIKSWSKNKKVLIRNPNSTRPWQHVLEALCGYLILSIKLNQKKNINGEAFNFGPNHSQDKSVISLLKEAKKSWKNVEWKIKQNKNKFYESKLLKIELK